MLKKTVALIMTVKVKRAKIKMVKVRDPPLGVGDGHREMHRLPDVLQFFETSLKNRIVKN